MAAKGQLNSHAPNSRRKRKGVHSKTKRSKLKSSKLYKKKYKAQGR
jgi:hypothetical protein